jgi:hypothetical protein
MLTDEAFRKALLEIVSDTHGDVHNIWKTHAQNLASHALNDPLDEMLTWSTLTATMIQGECKLIRDEYEALPEYIRERCYDSGFGKAPLLDGTMLNATYVHMAYHLFNWQNATDISLSRFKNIVEFGGGFGAMAVMVRRLGFKGKYTIYDIPQFSLVQRFFLDRIGNPGVTIPITEWRENITDKPDMLIASYSLSETKRELREEFFDTIDPTCALIAHQDAWEREDMNAYFEQFTKDRPQYNWHSPEAMMPGHHYRIGVKVDSND